MIRFNKPINLNGSELLLELANVGINLIPIDQSPFDKGDGFIWLDIDEADKAKAEAVVSAHNGTVISTKSTIEQKLAAAGLTVDELKTALGL
jgi:hypothetical protein